MELLTDSRIQLDHSEFRMLTVLCGYLSPQLPTMTIDQLRRCIGEVHADPPTHELAGIAHDLLADLLREAEELHASRVRH